MALKSSSSLAPQSINNSGQASPLSTTHIKQRGRGTIAGNNSEIIAIVIVIVILKVIIIAKCTTHIKQRGEGHYGRKQF